MEQWNNVELSNLTKKSYTLNHEYDAVKKDEIKPINNNETVTGSDNIVTKDSVELLQPGSDIKPKVQQEDVESLLRRLYGITISEIKEIISYDDRNYLIKEDLNVKNPLILTHWPHGYVLKILNALDSKKTDFVDAQNQLMNFLSKQNIQCPRPIINASGKLYSLERINGSDHIVRLLEYIPGEIFHQVEKTNYLIYQSGEYLARIDRALKNFTHEAYESHISTWMLQSVPKLRDFTYVLTDHSRKEIVEQIITAFELNVLSKLSEFDKQIIHGDYNEQNIIVSAPANSNAYKVTGIIDFGDTNKSPLIFEVGIAITYIMLQAKTLESGGIFLAGYESIQLLNAREKSYLKYCVAARLAQSLVMGQYTHSLDPTNDYVLVTQQQGWKLIEQLWCDNFENIDELWESAGAKYLTQSDK